MSVVDKYSLLNRDKLAKTIQIQLFRKEKKISEVFSAFLNPNLNFEHSEKRDGPDS